MKTPKVSIIISNYFKASRVVQNVKTILAQKINFDVEIIVSDNSVDVKNARILKTLKKYKNVKVIINKKNLGYPKGNNEGARQATGEYIAIVNPDIIWKDPKTLQKLIDYLENNKDVGIVAPKQINEQTGTPGMSVRAFPKLWVQVARRTWLRHLPLIKNAVAYDEMQHLNYNKTQGVQWLQSSFIVLSKALWDKLGGFDEDYYIFLSDTEICWQCWKNGKRVVYYPKVKVYEDGIRLSRGGFISFFKNWLIRQHFKDALQFQKKHLFEPKPKVY